MKKSLSILFLMAGVLLPEILGAQGTTYVSSLGGPSNGSLSVGSDTWAAGMFLTGTNAGGYRLDSVQLRLNAPSGNPSGFSVSIYSLPINPPPYMPGLSVGSLTGPDPSTAGLFTYAASDMVLLPRTNYFVVVTAASPVATGSYNFTLGDSTANYVFSEYWGMGSFYYTSPDGTSWTPYRFVSRLQFAVNATAIPEPSAISFLLLGSGVLVCTRRIGKRLSYTR